MRILKLSPPSMNTKDLLANLNQVFASNAVAGLANVCSGIWFARMLGPATLGDYTVLLVTLQIITALLVPGFNQALIREPTQQNLVSAATFATCAQSILVLLLGGILYLLSGWSSAMTWRELMFPGALLGASLILSFWSNLLASPLEAQMAYRAIFGIRMIAIATGIVVGLIATAQSWGIYALVLRDVFTAVMTFALIRRASPLFLTLQGWKGGIQDLFRFSAGLWSLNALEKLALRLDYAIVGFFFEKEVLGIYFAVRGLTEGALGFLVSPIQTVLYSYYCRIQISPTQLLRIAKGAVAIVAGVCALEGLAFFAGTWLVEALFSEQYSSGGALLMGLILYGGAIVWFENVKVLAMSWNVHRILIMPRIVQLAAILVTTLPLIKVWGLGGAGLAAGLAALFLALISTWQVHRETAVYEHGLVNKELEKQAV